MKKKNENKEEKRGGDFRSSWLQQFVGPNSGSCLDIRTNSLTNGKQMKSLDTNLLEETIKFLFFSVTF